MAFLGGFLVFLVTEYVRRPHLSFKPETGEIATNNGDRYRFLSVLVQNKQRRWRLLRLFDRTASNARCFVMFKDAASGQVLKTINGRWASLKEPYDYVAGKVDYGFALIPQREVLPPSDEELFPINIGIKFDNEPQFYAFNNESYAAMDEGRWRHSKFRFDNQTLVVSVRVLAEGRSSESPNYVIQNPNARVDNFGLVA